MTYTILHADDTLLVVDKAPGVLTVGHAGSRERCLLDDLRRDGHKVLPVHRLDRDTSGTLLLGLDPARRAELEQAFRRREVVKQYLALVHGVPQAGRATIDVPILDQGATARVDRRGQRAVSRYVVEQRFGSVASLLRVTLETGRHNQVRLHCAHIGHPLLGDRKYGLRPRGAAARDGPRDGARTWPRDGPERRGAGASAAPGVPRVMLHAERIALRHPATGRMLDVRAPLPADLLAALAALRGLAR
jgi:23S rRNA pseudouridine1911/1915/1917 synthase